MAVRLAELDGVDPPVREDEEAVSARVAIMLDDLVEPAKVIALEKLGEGESALRIAAPGHELLELRPPVQPRGFPGCSVQSRGGDFFAATSGYFLMATGTKIEPPVDCIAAGHRRPVVTQADEPRAGDAEGATMSR